MNEEKKLKSEMDSTLAEVLAPKSLALWKSLMKETGYHDVSIFDMVCNGIPLYGEHDLPPGAILDWRPAATSADELLTTSVWRRKAIQGTSPELDPGHQKDLHEASLAEVAKGHLHGPLDEQQVTEALGDSSWLFSPRFAVYQGEEKKVRPIDDCKRSAWTTEEPKIFGVTISQPKNWFYQKPKTENPFFLDFSLYELVLLRNWCSVAFRLINWYSVAFRLVNWYSVAFRLLVFQRGIHGNSNVHVFLVCSFLFCFLLCSFVLFFFVFRCLFFLSLCAEKTAFAFQDCYSYLNIYIYILYITYCYISLFIYIYICIFFAYFICMNIQLYNIIT